MFHCPRDMCKNRESLSEIFDIHNNYGLIYWPQLAEPNEGFYPEGYYTISDPNSYQRDRGITKVIQYISPGLQGNRSDCVHDNAFPYPKIQDDASVDKDGRWETWLPQSTINKPASAPTSPQKLIENHRNRMEALIERSRSTKRIHEDSTAAPAVTVAPLTPAKRNK